MHGRIQKKQDIPQTISPKCLIGGLGWWFRTPRSPPSSKDFDSKPPTHSTDRPTFIDLRDLVESTHFQNCQERRLLKLSQFFGSIQSKNFEIHLWNNVRLSTPSQSEGDVLSTLITTVIPFKSFWICRMCRMFLQRSTRPWRRIIHQSQLLKFDEFHFDELEFLDDLDITTKESLIWGCGSI